MARNAPDEGAFVLAYPSSPASPDLLPQGEKEKIMIMPLPTSASEILVLRQHDEVADGNVGRPRQHEQHRFGHVL